MYMYTFKDIHLFMFNSSFHSYKNQENYKLMSYKESLFDEVSGI